MIYLKGTSKEKPKKGFLKYKIQKLINCQVNFMRIYMYHLLFHILSIYRYINVPLTQKKKKKPRTNHASSTHTLVPSLKKAYLF